MVALEMPSAAPVILTSLTFHARVALVLAFLLFGVGWLYKLRSLAPGLRRLVAALPILVTSAAAPLLFHPEAEFISRFVTEFALTWLLSFKALAWVAGRGPLSRPWPFFQFAALALAPIIPAADTGTPKKTDDGGAGRGAGAEDSPLQAVARVVAKLSLIAGGVALLQLNLPDTVLELLYSLGLFAVLSLLMDGPAALFTSLLGFQVAPHFDEPWRADSVASFWSKRWNLAAGSTLRDLLYDPVLEGQLIPASRKARGPSKQSRPSSSRRLAGMVACFLGSAAMHELQFWYFKGHWSGGRYGGFFLAQIPMLLGERLLYGGLRRRGITVPRLVRAAVTLAFLLWTGHHFFWAPLREQGIMAVAEEAVTANVLKAKAAVGLVKRS